MMSSNVLFTATQTDCLATKTTGQAPVQHSIDTPHQAVTTMTLVPTRMKSWETIKSEHRWLKPIARLLGHSFIENKNRYNELAQGLIDGDSKMDDLLTWMMAANAAENKKLYEQAVQKGINSIENCPEPLATFFNHVDTLPQWLDTEKLARGQEFIAASGINANYILRDAALMGGYLLSGFNQTLILTGALNKSASKRLAETSKWWIDCTSEGGMNRFGAGFKSTLHVRMIHGLVRRNLAKRSEWQVNDWGTPISQVDMAATNLAFSSLFLMGLRAIGIFPTIEEAKAVMHLWKYIGWVMGVEEKWLSDEEIEGTILVYEFFQTQSPPDWTSKVLGLALANEPLEKSYQYFERLQRQFHYQKHLSINRYFLGRKKMENLGLPTYVLPWFPLMIVPGNLLTFRVQRAIPSWRHKQIKRGRQEQLAYLASFGKYGNSVLKPDEHHPAHVA